MVENLDAFPVPRALKEKLRFHYAGYVNHEFFFIIVTSTTAVLWRLSVLENGAGSVEEHVRRSAGGAGGRTVTPDLRRLTQTGRGMGKKSEA